MEYSSAHFLVRIKAIQNRFAVFRHRTLHCSSLPHIMLYCSEAPHGWQNVREPVVYFQILHYFHRVFVWQQTHG